MGVLKFYMFLAFFELVVSNFRYLDGSMSTSAHFEFSWIRNTSVFL